MKRGNEMVGRSRRDRRRIDLCYGRKIRGYTLIEVLVALAVLVVGFTALTTMTTRARRAAIAAEELSAAQLACQTRLNEMLAGVRPIAPVFNEPIAGLDNWLMSVELFPATKPGLTAVRIQLSRQPQPGETSIRHAGTDFFEITNWVNNSRLDPQILTALQRNPYGMTAAAMMPNPADGMTGGMPAGIMGGTTFADSMAGGGMMTGMGGDMSGFSGGAMPGASLAPFDYSGTADDIPPLSLDENTAETGGTSYITSEQRRQYRQSRNQPALTDSAAGAPPPLDLPPGDAFDPTAGAQTASATLTATLTLNSTSTTSTAPAGGDSDNASDDISGETSNDVAVEGANDLPETEDESASSSGTPDTEGSDTP